ncbi:MAG: N-acetylmuramoyl-L-alanine amidase [Sphingobium sp.]|nr:N-acetylmuramoyl-L-alanine amidase [Sphingobium sp.]
MLDIKSGVLRRNKQAVEQIKSKNVGKSFGSPPKIVIIHFTAGGSARSSANWFASAANTNSSAHVVIERDGSIIQCVSFEKIAWHAGKSTWGSLSGLNQYSIGIELANWGALKGAGGDWVNGAGQRVTNPFIGVHRNGNPNGSRTPIGWEIYPEAQFDAAVELVAALRASYGVDTILGHDDIAPTRKWDPGPAFDMARFRSRAFGDRRDDGANIVLVNAPNGLNMRAGPGLDFAIIASLKDKAPLEPIGQNGVWLEVSVLDAAGLPKATGWVHSHYVKAG